jgi:inhibitor of KinA
MNEAPRILRAGDSSIVVAFEDRIDTAVNDRVLALAATVTAEAVEGVRDVVPTYRTLVVHFDPLRTDVPKLLACVERDSRLAVPVDRQTPRLVRIPVCYGGEFGPDLAAVAAWAGLTERAVVALHSAARYRVFMLGFLPGFAYLATVDARIAMPRRESPRLRVTAGAVGIAGGQTGVYPLDSPGGWQIVGRTSVRPFDLSRPDPFLLQPGDTVEFFSVDRESLTAADLDGAAA